jgi:hypothetical protein
VRLPWEKKADKEGKRKGKGRDKMKREPEVNWKGKRK